MRPCDSPGAEPPRSRSGAARSGRVRAAQERASLGEDHLVDLLIDVAESGPGVGDTLSIHSHLKMDGAWVIGRVRVPAYKIRIALGTADAVASGIDREPRTWERPSDHAPVTVDLDL